MGTDSTIRIGARRSALSQRQVDLVVGLLAARRPEVRVAVEVFTTTGDRRLETPLPLLGGKGVFTEELEEALLAGRIDLAVHSLKDLPVQERPGLTIGAVPARAAVEDVVVSRAGLALGRLPSEATVGTSSVRRSAQLLRARPDLRIVSIRGNVETRLRKVSEPHGDLDAIVLARAGLERLDLLDQATETLPLDVMLPAPGQGALAVQCRDGEDWLEFLAPVHDTPTGLAVAAERAFLTGLGGGCSAPVAAHGRIADGSLELWGRVISSDGERQVEVRSSTCPGDRAAAERAGLDLARRARDAGGGDILARGDGWDA
jgi:hydroxymethylbilane synthase